jgi:tetratricopeptide (TPR) repeat protein
VVISAVSGMGGIGKSELALQYAYKHKATTYPGGICWLKAREDLGLQIVEFASFCKYLTPPSDWDLVKKVRWCWQQWRNEATLIIFDDVQGYGDIQPFLPPPQSQFRVLLTSRSKFPAPVQDCEIKVLNKDNKAIELLGSFSDDVKSRIAADLATAQKICHWLGYLPLGLELVGRYLANDQDLSVAEVWEYLNNEKLMAQALLTAEAGMTAELGVIAAFELSWQKLSLEAQELAARLSLFALAEIPWSLVEQCLSEWEPQQLKDLRRFLLRFSLLTRTRQGMYELHQLLREFFALKLAEMPERAKFTTKFAQVLTEIAKTIPQTVTLEHQTNLIELIPHLIVATEFSQYLKSIEKSWCCEGLGRFYKTQSQFTIAADWYNKSLYISEQQLGSEHPHTASCLHNLADVYRIMGRYTESETLHMRAIIIWEQHLGTDNLLIANSLNSLALLYDSMGWYAKAEPLYVKSLAISEQQQEVDHIHTAISLNNLAGLYDLMGRYNESEPLYLRSLNIFEQELGAEHPETATILNNLAELYRLTCKYDEAKTLYKRSLAIREKELGANHPATAASLNNLAGLYKSISRHAEAEPLYVQSLAIREKELGANHPATAASLNNLAGLYELIGRYAEAEPLYVRSLAINEQELGANHPATATSLNNLSSLYYSMGRYTEAEPLLVQALSIFEDKLGENHPETQNVRNNLQTLRQQL